MSIITPVFNSEKYIADAIDSVLSQTYQNWEHLIVDDCSNDRSWDIINVYARKENRIRIFRLDKNSGPGKARNYAIEKAGGRYIAFLDSDDIWIEDRLEKHIHYMMERGIAFSHASYGYLKSDGSRLSKVYHIYRHPVDYNYLLKRTDISCLTAIYDQLKIGKFYMPEIRRKQDYGLWLSILKAGYVSIPYPEVLAYYRQRKGSVTNKKSRLIIQHYEFLRNNEHLNILKSIKYTLYWGIGGAFKYFL